jgi:two-component system, OmpR family, sensor histidine kinase BaeS
MTMRRSLVVKLTVAFVFVSLVGIVFLSLLVRRITVSEFNDFQRVQGRTDILRLLETYYINNDETWDGLGRSIRPRFDRRFNLRENFPGLVVADADGVVVIGPPGEPVGSQLTETQRRVSLPVEVAGETVGYLINEPALRGLELSGAEDYIRAINRTIVFSALAAVGLALLLGVILARRLVQPLRAMTAATRAIAAGDLEQRVQVRTQDELGELARAFNRMNAELARARDLRRQMTADIAHDLRTPLSIILGHAEGLSDGVLPPTNDTFEMIHEEALRLNRLIEDLRTLSLSEAGELSLQRQRLRPRTLIDRVAGAYQPQAIAEGITIETHAPDHLPPLDVDPDRMAQVLDNLLSNGLRYTPSGGMIGLGAQHTNGAVQMIVKDSGPGLPADQLPYIFDRFYRADRSRRRHEGGSGLGLAIAKSLVEAHGGRIHAESVPGAGLKFVITLPTAG